MEKKNFGDFSFVNIMAFQKGDVFDWIEESKMHKAPVEVNQIKGFISSLEPYVNGLENYVGEVIPPSRVYINSEEKSRVKGNRLDIPFLRQKVDGLETDFLVIYRTDMEGDIDERAKALRSYLQGNSFPSDSIKFGNSSVEDYVKREKEIWDVLYSEENINCPKVFIDVGLANSTDTYRSHTVAGLTFREIDSV